MLKYTNLPAIVCVETGMDWNYPKQNLLFTIPYSRTYKNKLAKI